jgi:two-component system response regulator BaeR
MIVVHKIIVVEDDEELAGVLCHHLVQSGFTVSLVADGAEVMKEVNSFRPDLMLLDLKLPNIDGIELCHKIRQSQAFQHLPIIITTARVAEADRLLGLELGADDYVCKPYSPREVVARVKAVLRRHHYQAAGVAVGLEFDDEKMMARLNDQDLGLTTIEYTLLSVMTKALGTIYSRAQLIEKIYRDYRVVSERTIDSHIKKLRQKITRIDQSVELVHSVYGLGYKVDYISTD